MAEFRSGQLTIDDFKLVHDILYSVRSKWQNIALQLDISINCIDAIEKSNNNDVDKCLRAIISVYLRTTSPSWEAIAAALKAESVGYEDVASAVEKNYLQSSSEASHEILTPDSVVQMQNTPLQTSDFGFQCLCGECTLDSYFRKGCPRSADHGKLNAAILDVSRIESLQKRHKEHLEFQLSVESRKIMDSFGNLCLDTLKSLENQNKKASRVAVTVIFSQKFQSRQDHLTKVELELFAANEVHEVFTLLKIHNIISFLEYRPLDRIIMDLGTEEDKDRLESYKRQLQHFCKRRVYEAPCSALTLTQRSKHENCSEFVVLMDKEMESTITFHDIKYAEIEIANILKLVPGAQIYLHKVCPGSVLLHFTVPLSDDQSIFPLKLLQIAMLKNKGFSVIRVTNHFTQVSMIHKDYTRKKIMYQDFDFKEAECFRCCRILQDPQFTSCCGVNYCKQCIVNNDQCCSCGEKSFSILSAQQKDERYIKHSTYKVYSCTFRLLMGGRAFNARQTYQRKINQGRIETKWL